MVYSGNAFEADLLHSLFNNQETLGVQRWNFANPTLDHEAEQQS